MREHSGDVTLRHRRQVVLVAVVEERVAILLEQRLVRVHAVAVHSEDGLRHERRVHAELLRRLLHREAVRHDVVGHGQRVGVPEVDLVLRRGHLVVHVLHGDAHRLQVLHGALAVVGGHADQDRPRVADPHR